MKQKTRRSLLIAAVAALTLAGCQKEEIPTPEVPAAEAPPQAYPAEPALASDMPAAWTESTQPEKMAPDGMPGTRPAQ